MTEPGLWYFEDSDPLVETSRRLSITKCVVDDSRDKGFPVIDQIAEKGDQSAKNGEQRPKQVDLDLADVHSGMYRNIIGCYKIS